MIIGIDVGGTHADGVLLQGRHVVRKKKVSVDHDYLEASVITLLESLLPEDGSQPDRIHLSTTLCTNALISGKLDEVGMVIQAGPGTNPDFLRCGGNEIFLSGAVDHRGQIIRSPDLAELKAAVSTFKEKNISALGVVTKFSHRNSEHELWVQEKLVDSFAHISLGHRMSGMPNFPRRVYTTWLNSALHSTFSKFRDAMEKGVAKLGITCPCYILKADGGTIPFSVGCEFPCQSIHSGPSASVMGALALFADVDDAILLDIGGTTTDIALYSEGVPLLEPYGATVDGRPTLIRALLTKSVGLGGDSRVVCKNGKFFIGPEKEGPPMTLGGNTPTPTDAMILLGQLNAGSIEEAKRAMALLQPGQDPEKTAVLLLESFARHIHEAAQMMIEEIFKRPVFTVSAFLERERIEPDQLITIGGPAGALQKVLSREFKLECRVPDDFEVANAIGAARARLTLQASLYGDTAVGRYTIPEISCMESTGRMFDMVEGETRLAAAVREMAERMGERTPPEIDFIERLEMNTVRGFATTGKIISLKAQIRPGLAQVEE